MFLTRHIESYSHPFSVLPGKPDRENQIAKIETRAGWIIDHLDIQPFERILEIGCGAGFTLAEVSKAMKGGFLAAAESSLPLFRQAMQRNRSAVGSELVQLHAGEAAMLPFPHNYFDSAYFADPALSRKELQSALIQVTELLRPGGMLLVLIRVRADSRVNSLTPPLAPIDCAFMVAGLSGVSFTDYELDGENWILAKGFRE